MNGAPTPLPANHRLLRNGRYEVRCFHLPVDGRYLPIGEVARFANIDPAEVYARSLVAPIVTIDRVAPANSRYPDGDWSIHEVLKIMNPESCAA